MSETAPRTQTESPSQYPVIANAPAALQLEFVDGLVGYDAQLAEQFTHEDDQSDYEAYRERKVDELLAENGIVDGDDEEVHAQYLLAKDIYMQVIQYDEDEWLVRQDGAEVPPRNLVFRRILAEYPTESTRGRHVADSETTGTDESANQADTNASDVNHTETSDTEDGNGTEQPVDMDALHEEALVENARFDVNGARESWATVSAKRQGRGFGKTKDHDAVRDDYHAKVQALGILELEGRINPEDDEVTKNATVIAYLFEEQRRLRELTTEKLQGTKVGKFVKFMNKGSFGMRLLKGFGVGVVVGTGGALLLGAAGAAAGAAVAVGASRFVKGYASNDRHRGMQTAEESFIDENGENLVYLEESDGASVADKVSAAARTYNEDFEHDTKQEQVKRRKALAWGVGSVAVGAGVGYGIAHTGDAIDAVKDWWNGPNAKDLTPGGVAPQPDMDHDGIADQFDHDRDGDGVPNRFDDAPNNPDVTDRGPDWSDFNRDARIVEPGEGGFQTLKEMGIPENKWESIWQDAGEKLHEEGKTYTMDDGRWGWDRSMRLTDHDLNVIAQAAQRNGVNL